MSLNSETDFVNYKTIFSHVGKIDGFICECDLSEIMNKFDERLIFSLKSAKGVMVYFEMSESVKLANISDLMEQIKSFTQNNTDVMFETTTNNSLVGQSVKFRIVITGVN